MRAAALGNQLLSLKKQIVEFDRMIMAWHRSNQTSKRLHYPCQLGTVHTWHFSDVAARAAVIRYAKIHGTKHRPWLTALLKPIGEAPGGGGGQISGASSTGTGGPGSSAKN